MKPVLMYTKTVCPYCIFAKKLLKSKGVPFKEVNLSGQHKQLQELVQKTGMRTVPQIFVGDHFVGGFDELSTSNQSGELDRLLK
ncbi:MAG: glutaredoxin 3 [Bdellovibrionaceae bacterium]|jgi:glutaredoxin 3|nr:glutaredoxin 3 [Pseudobdellovibrionaceae bacterium]